MIPVTKTDHRKLIEAITDGEPISVAPDAMKFVHKIVSGTGRNLLQAYESTKNLKKSVQSVFERSDALRRDILAEVQRVLPVPAQGKEQRVRSILAAHRVPKDAIDPILKDLKSFLPIEDDDSEGAYEPIITRVPHDVPSVSLVFTAILEYLMAEIYDAAMDDDDFDGESVTLENILSGISTNASLAAYISL